MYINIKKLLIFIFFILSLTIFFLLKYEFIFHKKISLLFSNNINLQGIECINNELFLTSNESEIFQLKDSSMIKIGEMIRRDEEFYNNKYILAHLNSIVPFNDMYVFVLGNLSSSPPVLALIDYESFMDKKTLKNIDIVEMSLKNEFTSLHIENFFFRNKYYLLFAGRKNNNNIIQLYDVQSKKTSCDYIIKKDVQNIFWNNQKNTLIVSQNIFGYTGGKLEYFSIEENELDINCPEFKKYSKKFVLTLKELQGYTVCNSTEYFLYTSKNKSYIYTNSIM